MQEKIHIFNSEKTFQDALLSSIRSRILKKNSEDGAFRLALSGGSTPGPIYEKLSQSSDIDWSRVEFYLVDERYVPREDKFSNTKLIEKNLIHRLSSKPAKWVTFDTSLSIEESLQSYEEQLDMSHDAFFDLILLGMGTDGHTASLFPDDDLLKEKKKWIGHSSNGNPIKDRLSLTYPALESSSEIFFLIKGYKKEDILEIVEDSKTNNSHVPSARVFHQEKTQVFFGKY
jgi:6-phosphogluconolactonase